MFDPDLEACGACGVTKKNHADACDPAALQRVTELEGQLDRELDTLLAAASAA
ncbi:hypothetical protein ACFORH_43215 [Amycolatopsis roodepoortensis]|uniref:Uncharacterized protein n=1 Tax=Amycolatopsis roodepoortensis TaxID=700274 RepID=A0ABR9LIP9_9PSEU|nr:hypothetical protein [Amycolatopsis roodepoortensis]MBE1580447.1 hypothetical protein [Amycolatopsis roodepoortensis]